MIIACALLSAGVAAADADERSEWLQRVDRIVAVVDADPIFESDLERARALGAAARDDPEADDDAADDADRPAESARDRLLRQVIDERLRSHEVERAELPPIDEVDVAAQLELIEQRFGGRDALLSRLDALGLTLDDLETLVRRQLRLLVYVEERLGPRIFVDPQDVEAYHDGPLRSEMTARGEPLPPLAEVRDAIRTLLYERSLTREIDAWTDRLRRQAEIRTFDEATSLDERVDPRILPPIWREIESSGDQPGRPPEDQEPAQAPEDGAEPVAGHQASMSPRLEAVAELAMTRDLEHRGRQPDAGDEREAAPRRESGYPGRRAPRQQAGGSCFDQHQRPDDGRDPRAVSAVVGREGVAADPAEERVVNALDGPDQTDEREGRTQVRQDDEQ